jgi:hypothetical protein
MYETGNQDTTLEQEPDEILALLNLRKDNHHQWPTRTRE